MMIIEAMSLVGEQTKSDDFDDFWNRQIQLVQGKELNTHFQPTTFSGQKEKVFKVSVEGLDGTPVIGWYIHHSPKPGKGCLITTHGFKSSRKSPSHYAHWTSIGYDVIAFDVRLQSGETGFNSPISGPLIGNVCTLNLLDEESYYLKHLYTDTMMMIRLGKSLGYSTIVLEGTSQAGGLMLAAGALLGQVNYILANVPSFSDMENRVRKGTGSLKSIQTYLSIHPDREKEVMRVLSYFDLKNMADRIHAPVYCSVGLLDQTCPAENFYPAYSRITSPKQLVCYPYNGHEGGSDLHKEKELALLAAFIEQIG